MEEKDKRFQIGRRGIIAVLSCVTVLILILFWNSKAPFLIDNDNIYLKTIASGEMTGKPEAHMYYMGILSGTLLSSFYSMTGNGIPWFGIFLCVSMGVPMALLLGRSLEKCNKWWSGVVVWVVYVIGFCTFFYHYFARTQFTLATGIIGTGALFLLCMMPVGESFGECLPGAVPFLLLSGWSMGMRDKGFFMLLPFLGMTFLGKMVFEKSGKVIRNVFLLGGLFTMLMAVLYLGNRLSYSSEEWQEFKAYTDASETLYDFDGFPAYESHREIYERMGITPSSFEAMTKHYNILLDPAVNRENMVELAKIAEAERKQSQVGLASKALDVFRLIIKRNLMDYMDRPINVLVFLLYFFVLLLGLLQKKWRVLVELLFLIIARMFDWIYLVWYGRYPFRVTQIIFVAELVVLVAVILKYELWKMPEKEEKEKKEEKTEEKEKGLHPVFLLLVLAVTFAGIRFGNPVMKGVYQQINGVRELSVCFPQLEEYLSAHAENFYYFDMSHLYYMEDTLALKPSKYENYIYMGSWMPGSPWYRHKLEAHGITDIAGALLEKENVFILYQQVDFDTRDFLDDYFEEHFPGTKIRVVDTFTSSNGFCYEVLKPEREAVFGEE